MNETGIDRRRPLTHRILTDVLYRKGRFESVKLFQTLGQFIVAWWMLAYPEKLLSDWWLAVTVASLLVVPSLAHKLIAKRMEAGK